MIETKPGIVDIDKDTELRRQLADIMKRPRLLVGDEARLIKRLGGLFLRRFTVAEERRIEMLVIRKVVKQ